MGSPLPEGINSSPLIQAQGLCREQVEAEYILHNTHLPTMKYMCLYAFLVYTGPNHIDIKLNGHVVNGYMHGVFLSAPLMAKVIKTFFDPSP